MKRTGQELMRIESIPDWEQRVARHDAFWQREVLGRPPAYITLDKPAGSHPQPAEKNYSEPRDWWMDFEYRAECILADVENAEYLGDALPQTYSSLGPEVFAAFLGCEMEYADRITSWSIPSLPDWQDVGTVKFSEENPYWRKVIEFTNVLLEVGRERFYTGLTDLHPGGDALAAFRDPQRLNVDLIESPDEVKALLRYVDEVYRQVYDFYYDKLSSAGQAITTWMPICSTKRWYVPSNDFSCMISPRMFREFFLPGLIEEFGHYDACIYHLDGPGALKHLDVLLEVPELNAIQWVAGAGNGGVADWMWVYEKCQAARKGLEIATDVSELDAIMENLRPEGIFLHLWGFDDRAHAEWVLRRLERWR